MPRNLQRVTNIDYSALALLLLLQLAANIILICNPGTFSHDEWALANRTTPEQFGAHILFHFMDWNNTLYRPIGWILAYAFEILSQHNIHLRNLLSILQHFLNAALLFILLMRYGLQRRVALVASSVFAFNTCSTFGVAWSMAVFDRGVTALLLIICLIDQAIRSPKHSNDNPAWKYLTLILVTVLALLCKEVAYLIPILLLLLLCLPNHRRIFAPFIIVSIIVLSLFTLRLGVFNSLSTNLPGPGAYQLGSMTTSLKNLTRYLLSPFCYGIPEIAIIYNPAFRLATNLAILLFAIYWGALLWLKPKVLPLIAALYLLPLLPALPLDKIEGQYLYASGIALSLGLALLLTGRSLRIGLLLVFSLGSCLLAIHFKETFYFYKTGTSQQEFFAQYQTSMLKLPAQMPTTLNVFFTSPQDQFPAVLLRHVSVLPAIPAHNITARAISESALANYVHCTDCIIFELDQSEKLRRIAPP